MRPYGIFGKIGEDIDIETVDQFKMAMSIPPAVRGALMPDGHLGYSVPIGGVVLLDNAVSPSFVGLDISCMMMLSVFAVSGEDFVEDRELFTEFLKESTCFGVGGKTQNMYSPIFDSFEWKGIPILKQYMELARSQLGTSGSGNHFADLMVLHPREGISFAPLEQDKTYMALVTHSGSRGVGNKVAQHYIRIADEQRPKDIRKGYGWLSLDTEEGQEYMQVLEALYLYSKTNHDIIHNNFTRFIGGGTRLISRIHNIHNWAWELPGKKVLHRKGATPAHEGDYGVIPGSSGSPSYVVRGLGYSPSLWSASHGAGRIASRKQARAQFNKEQYEENKKEMDVLHIGVATDETVDAYKDIRKVISLQEDKSIAVEAEMFPKVVIMGDGRSADG